MSIRKTDIPSERFLHSAAGVVRARSSIRSDSRARLRPDLLAVDYIAALAVFSALVLSCVVSLPVVGSVTPKACSRNSPDAIFGQVFRLLLVRSVLQHRAHRVHLRMTRRRIGACWHGSSPAPRPLPTSGRPEPPYSSGIRAPRKPDSVSALTKSCRIGVFLVELQPILIREIFAEPTHSVADILPGGSTGIEIMSGSYSVISIHPSDNAFLSQCGDLAG